MLQGARGQVPIHKFEYAIGLLLTSLGFRTLHTGRIFEPGPDLLALSRADRVVLVIECGRKKVRQKIEDCVERVSEFRQTFPQCDYVGMVFTSSEIPSERRVEMAVRGVVLLDADDIGRLLDIAVRVSDPKQLLDSFIRAAGGAYLVNWDIRW